MRPDQALHLPARSYWRMETVHKVNFITCETGDDLIVSFAIFGKEIYEVLSLTLLRTPKYEFLLEPKERGVSVCFEECSSQNEL